jgi:hypothetical protein
LRWTQRRGLLNGLAVQPMQRSGCSTTSSDRMRSYSTARSSRRCWASSDTSSNEHIPPRKCEHQRPRCRIRLKSCRGEGGFEWGGRVVCWMHCRSCRSCTQRPFGAEAHWPPFSARSTAMVTASSAGRAKGCRDRKAQRCCVTRTLANSTASRRRSESCRQRAGMQSSRRGEDGGFRCCCR